MFTSGIFKEFEQAAQQEDPIAKSNSRNFNNDNNHLWRPHTRAECENDQIGMRQIYRLRLLPNKREYVNPIHNMYTRFATIRAHKPFRKPSYVCGTMYGETCHICELQQKAFFDMKKNETLYTDFEKEFIMDMRATETNFVHVLVVEDKLRPQNQGKVFIMELKGTVMNLVNLHRSQEEMEIKGRPEDVCEVFSPSRGAELVLVVDYNKPNQEIYSATNFQKCNTPFAQTEEEGIKAIESIHDLSDKRVRFFDPFVRDGDAKQMLDRYLKEDKENQMKTGPQAEEYLAKVSGNPTEDFNTFDDDVPFDVTPTAEPEVNFNTEKPKTVVDETLGDVPFL